MVFTEFATFYIKGGKDQKISRNIILIFFLYDFVDNISTKIMTKYFLNILYSIIKMFL